MVINGWTKELDKEGKIQEIKEVNKNYEITIISTSGETKTQTVPKELNLITSG